eukprot:3067358-Prymnesium_polylepis.1
MALRSSRSAAATPSLCGTSVVESASTPPSWSRRACGKPSASATRRWQLSRRGSAPRGTSSRRPARRCARTTGRPPTPHSSWAAAFRR